MYNYVFIVGRTVFWDMQNLCPLVWIVLDYVCDFLYLCDMIVHAHEGIHVPKARMGGECLSYYSSKCTPALL